MKQTKCYCGHTTTCDCGPLEEPKQSTKDRIMSETSEETKQKARDYGNSLVNKQEQDKKMYSEEDIMFAYEQGAKLALISQSPLALHKGNFPTPKEWLNQFKKK